MSANMILSSGQGPLTDNITSQQVGLQCLPTRPDDPIFIETVDVTNLDPAAFASVFDLITEHGVQTVGTPFAFEFLTDPEDPTAVRAELYQHREPVFDVMITPSGSRVEDPKEKTGEEAAEDPAN